MARLQNRPDQRYARGALHTAEADGEYRRNGELPPAGRDRHHR